ncbi:hypothetical protein Lal_00036977 [Lupinus albus]|nr:hypothetical protein Lal_00036977 [Lupinus albus]
MRKDLENNTLRGEETETETETISSMSKNSAILFGKYKIHKLLGIGASAKVYHATNIDTGKSVAIKVVNKHKAMKSGFNTNIEREISIMHKLHHHPNIVKIFEVLATKTKIYIVMEFVSGGEIFQEVSTKGHLSEDLSRKYFRQLISAVKYCHSNGVFHRDLKLDNLLIDENKDLKVSDFGLSAVKDSTQLNNDALLKTVCGTPAYVAPEILSKKGYDGAKVDVWSCGVVLFALSVGYLPFNDYNITVLYRKIYRGQFRLPKGLLSHGLRNIISRMLDTNPQTRITIDEILQDAWFKDGECKPKPDMGMSTKHDEWEKITNKCLNAFDLISFSSGLDLSSLVVNSNVMDQMERMILRETCEKVMEKVEDVAKRRRVTITKKKNDFVAKLDGQDGNFVAYVVCYQLTDELLVVELKRKEKQKGSSSQFWKDLRSQIIEFTL